MAVRWATPEVLMHEKVSIQSDVWAMGVLCREVFSGGPEPYSHVSENLSEVSLYVKDGGRLTNPNSASCSEVAFTELMQPCWADAAAERPGFGELYDVALKHGAQEDEEVIESRVARRPEQVDGTLIHRMSSQAARD